MRQNVAANSSPVRSRRRPGPAEVNVRGWEEARPAGPPRWPSGTPTGRHAEELPKGVAPAATGGRAGSFQVSRAAPQALWQRQRVRACPAAACAVRAVRRPPPSSSLIPIQGCSTRPTPCRSACVTNGRRTRAWKSAAAAPPPHAVRPEVQVSGVPTRADRADGPPGPVRRVAGRTVKAVVGSGRVSYPGQPGGCGVCQ